MKNSRLAELVRDRPEKYPYQLEQHHGRILDRILKLWGTPAADQYFLDLLVDSRGTRQGFSIKVAEEIYFLSELHSSAFSVGSRAVIADDRERVAKAEQRAVKFRTTLIERGFKFVPGEMFRCIASGDIANVVMFVNAGMHVDVLNERGWTPLMVALFEGQEKVALFLIRKGADPYFRDTTGYRPIHWAAFHGYVSVIRELAERRAKLDIKTDFGWPPLLQAAARGFAVAVDTLAELGADVDISDEEGWTALHKAAANGFQDVVAVLLLHGANLDARHRDGRTPLLVAIENGERDIAKMLLQARADAWASENNGVTALHMAAARNDENLIDLLLASGAQCSQCDKRGVTPLLYAVESGAINAIRKLIAAGADIVETLGARSEDQDSPDPGTVPGRVGILSTVTRLARRTGVERRFRLHEAVRNNDALKVRAELANGADVNAVGPQGMTPLEIAAAHGHRQMWGVLIDFGAGRRPVKA